MGFEHAGLVQSSLPASHFAEQCRKKRIGIKKVFPLLSSDGTTQFQVLEFNSESDMVNACHARLIGLDVLPMKIPKIYSKLILHAHPKGETTNASAKLEGRVHETMNIDTIQGAVSQSIDDGKPSKGMDDLVTIRTGEVKIDVERRSIARVASSGSATAA